MKKINWNLKDYELIKDIIKIIRHYEKKTSNVNDKDFCFNQLRRFKYEKYIIELKKDLSLQWKTIRFLKHGRA